MAGRTVDLAFRADLSQLVSQLKTLPGTTEKEAKKMAASLERQIKKAEKASVRAAKASAAAGRRASTELGKTASSLKNLEHAGGETSSILGGVASALDLVSPQAGAAARALGDLAGGAEMVARSGPRLMAILGPVAVAAGIAGLAFQHFSNDLAEAEGRMKAASQRAVSMGKIFGSVKTEKARVALELAVARGEKDVEQLVRFNAEQRTSATFAGSRAEAIRQVTSAQAALTEATEKQTKMQAIIDKGVTKRSELSGYMEARREMEGQNQEVANLNVKHKATLALTEKLVADQKTMTEQIVERSKIQAVSGGGVRSAKQVKEVKTELQKLNEQTQAMLPARDISKFEELTEHLSRLEAAAAAAGGELAQELGPAIVLVNQALAKITADKAAADLGALVDEVNRLAPPETISRMAELEAAQRLINDAVAAGGAEADALGKKLDQINAAIRVESKKTKDAMSKDASDVAKKIAEEAKEVEAAWINTFASIASMSADIATTIATRAADAASAEVDLLAEGLDSREAMLEDERDHRAQLLEESAERDVSRELAASEAQIAMLTTAAEAERAALASAEAAKAKAVGDAFALSKALNLAEIAMSTAAAVMAALKVPPPAGFVLAGVVAALGATQAGLVASQEPPASMHLGGLVGGRPDERMITARAGEGVLTRQGVNAIGGESGLAAANRGQGGGPLIVQMVYRQKVLDEVLTDSVRRGGPIGGAINRRAPRGRRNPHGRRAS